MRSLIGFCLFICLLAACAFTVAYTAARLMMGLIWLFAMLFRLVLPIKNDGA